jgi:hypothetical protein
VLPWSIGMAMRMIFGDGEILSARIGLTGCQKKDATGFRPSRPNFRNSLVQALRAPWLPS